MELPVPGRYAIDASRSSVQFAVPNRDERLRGSDFFDVANHPTMSFRGTRVTGSGTSWTLGGDLTIRGVTSPVALDVTFEGAGVDPWGDRRIAFSASGEVDRERWGMTWNQTLETGGLFVGKRARLDIEVEAVDAR